MYRTTPFRLALLRLPSWVLVATVVSLLAVPSAPAADEAIDDAFREFLTRPYTGDLDGLIQRRVIRALVVYSKTLYFYDGPQPRGLSHDALVEFEQFVNRQLGIKPDMPQIRVVFVPVNRDELFPALVNGRGDIAAASLTVTPERQAVADFSDPFYTNAAEIVVSSEDQAPLASAEALSGEAVLVRASSSYYESLQQLNKRLRAAGRAPVTLHLADDHLEDEDLLEMVNAGLVRHIVVDDFKARFWAQVFPHIRLQPQAALRTQGDIAWAVRKGSPKLKQLIDRFVVQHRAGTLEGNLLLREYLRSAEYVKKAFDDQSLARFRQTVDLFRKYGDRYRFDYLMALAQGYQESKLDQSVRSDKGAVGIMQLLPSTGAGLDVGDIEQAEPNVHGGVKYMRQLIDTYFDDPGIDDANRILFAFAAYNAGPATVTKLRREAAQRGLDPNRWFNNVELVAARRIGRQTVQYVSNISKYYVAYRLAEEERAEREAARDAAAPR